MRTFGKDSPEFMAFQIAGSDDVYKMPLASSLPMSELLELSEAAAKGGAHILRYQLDLLRKHIGPKADELTAQDVADIFAAWNEESGKTGASASD